MIKKIKIFLGIVIILSIAAAILFTPVINVLSLSSRKNPAKRFYSIEGYTRGFVISYTHSVNKGRVHDFYKPTEDKKIELYKTSFVSYGAGIPEAAETPGAVFTVTDDSYIIENINRVVPRLVMAVGIIANHTIMFDALFHIDDYKYDLKDYFEPQTSIILQYKKVSIVSYLIHEL